MTLDKTQFTNMTTRQKAIAGASILIFLVVIWQAMSLFSGRNKSPASQGLSKNGMASSSGGGNTQPMGPQPAQINQQTMTSQQQSELMKLQQETQQKYVTALNELQMLKLSQQIAETNKDIAAAKLATVTAEKGIVDLLTKPAPSVETPESFSQRLVTPGGGPLTIPAAMPSAPTPMSPPVLQQATAANYIVVSVSKLLNKWSAVVGYQGKLYSIFVGDVLPPDQSMVISIDKYSVILEKDGVQRKISLVPII